MRKTSEGEGAKATVLLVDDEPDFLEILTVWLTSLGYAVHAAKDGFEAIATAKRTAIDVMITDLRMPGMSGHHLLAVMKALNPSVEVIILSGEGTMDDAIETLREGRAFDFLQKPLKNLHLVNDAIERSRRRHPPMSPPCPPHVEALSERETEIVRHLALGIDNMEIATRLGISEKTVKNHLTRIYGKLKVSNRTQAVMLAKQYRLF